MKLNYLIKIMFIMFSVVFLYSCKSELIEKVENKSFCDVENVNDSLKTIYGKGDMNVTFKGYKLLNSDIAYSGKNSLNLNKKMKFAFANNFTVEDTTVKYRITTMVKGNSEKVFVVASGKNDFYVQSDSIFERNEDGWQQIRLDFKLPKTFIKGDVIKTYVWNFGGDSIFVDDFSVNVVTLVEKE